VRSAHRQYLQHRRGLVHGRRHRLLTVSGRSTGLRCTHSSWWLLFWTSLSPHRRIFKWLTLALFAYSRSISIASGLAAVLRATLIPHVQWTAAYWPRWSASWEHHLALPLLLQAAEEVEEDIALGRRPSNNVKVRPIGRCGVRERRPTGMFFSTW